MAARLFRMDLPTRLSRLVELIAEVGKLDQTARQVQVDDVDTGKQVGRELADTYQV